MLSTEHEKQINEPYRCHNPQKQKHTTSLYVHILINKKPSDNGIKHIVGRFYIVKPTCMRALFHIIQVADAVISRQ